jgi:hypothetical protein
MGTQTAHIAKRALTDTSQGEQNETIFDIAGVP